MIWEYLTFTDINPSDKLNELGREGWELVALWSPAQGGPVSCYLKRPQQKDLQS